MTTEFVTKLPDNAIADAGISLLRKYNVGTSHIVLGGERIGIFYAEKGASQRASTIVYDRMKEEEMKPQDVVLSIRPEELYVKPEGEDGVTAYVDDAVFLGLNTHYFIHFENSEKAEIIQESQIDSIIKKGTKICLGVKTQKINVFDVEGKRNLVKGVVNDLDAYNGASC